MISRLLKCPDKFSTKTSSNCFQTSARATQSHGGSQESSEDEDPERQKSPGGAGAEGGGEHQDCSVCPGNKLQ